MREMRLSLGLLIAVRFIAPVRSLESEYPGSPSPPRFAAGTTCARMTFGSSGSVLPLPEGEGR
jgi:hypothetical protein